jgi:hypothetical protein
MPRLICRTHNAHTRKSRFFLARSRLSHREFLIPFLARLSPKPLPIPVDAALCSHCPGPMIRRRRVPISFRYPSKKKSPRPVFSSTLPPLHRPLSFDPLSRTHPFPIPPQIPPPAPNSGCLQRFSRRHSQGRPCVRGAPPSTANGGL